MCPSIWIGIVFRWIYLFAVHQLIWNSSIEWYQQRPLVTWLSTNFFFNVLLWALFLWGDSSPLMVFFIYYKIASIGMGSKNCIKKLACQHIINCFHIQAQCYNSICVYNSILKINLYKMIIYKMQVKCHIIKKIKCFIYIQ